MTEFKILIDNREQTPLPFSPNVPTAQATLYPGDYSLLGYEREFAIERKSLEDLVGSLIGHKTQADGKRRYNRDRLIEELTAMRDFRFKCVIVTSSRQKLEAHYYTSRIEPTNIIGMISSIEALTGVQFKFYNSPEEAARWVTHEALHYWRLRNGLSALRPKLQPERLTPRAVPAPRLAR